MSFQREYSVFVSSSADQKNHSTTEDSLKCVQHYHTGIAAKRERRSVDPGIFVKIVLSTLRLRRRSTLLLCTGGEGAGGRQRPLSAHSSSLSGFHHSSIYLSVHSSLHPSVHIAFCCTCGSICHKSVAARRFTYRRLSRASLQVFQILDEMHIPVGLASGWRHLQVHGRDFFFSSILPI